MEIKIVSRYLTLDVKSESWNNLDRFRQLCESKGIFFTDWKGMGIVTRITFDYSSGNKFLELLRAYNKGE